MIIYSNIERKGMCPMKGKPLEEVGCDVRIVHLDRVMQAREESIPAVEVERLALVYKILGDPTRLKIALALMMGEMCVCDLAAHLGLSESAISHQIRRLRDQALVKSRRDGQVLYYSLDDHHVEDLIAMGLEHVRE
jgi:DNA-binding transcriptional ArsR family regulator